jgi:hypothetical protein
MTLTVKETKRQRYIRRIAESFGYCAMANASQHSAVMSMT